MDCCSSQKTFFPVIKPVNALSQSLQLHYKCPNTYSTDETDQWKTQLYQRIIFHSENIQRSIGIVAVPRNLYFSNNPSTHCLKACNSITNVPLLEMYRSCCTLWNKVIKGKKSTNSKNQTHQGQWMMRATFEGYLLLVVLQSQPF